ncbi:uncharacterized protein LOC136084787 [Hydra vulgaris]|uniref:Uncharacterized protein LOC136075076 n=1 Tax=Hydra vulgaris TaxID=6087 RepID=A0ABM4B3I8_HYDVU
MKRNRQEYMKSYMKRYRSVKAVSLISNYQTDLLSSSLNESSEAISLPEKESRDDFKELSVSISEYLSEGENGCQDDESNVCDFSSDFEFSETDIDSEPKPVYIICEELAQVAVKHNLTRDAINDILLILSQSGKFEKCDIPKDARTLIKTPSSIDVLSKCDGSYIYIGLKKGIDDIFAINNVEVDTNFITIDVNIDGLPIQRSNNLQFWPILCSIVNIISFPFLVAIYSGSAKPSSVHDFLQDFVTEVNNLTFNGLVINEKHYKFNLRSFICDAPARAFVRCCSGHTSKNGCERCTSVAECYERRIVYTNDNANLRTDAEFRSNAYPLHKNGNSPCLLINNLDMVRSFVIEPMHNLFLGVCRRFLFFLKFKSKIHISFAQQQLISNRMLDIAQSTPSDFVRQPRGLSEIERWKATEFRQFTLYTGIVVLEKILDNEVYNLFVAFAVAVRILHIEDDDDRNDLLPFAKKLFATFVHNSRKICGKSFVTFNVHNLLHIVDDAKYYNCSMNDISAFKFENYLQYLKKITRNAKYNPIVSVAKRFKERSILVHPSGYVIKSAICKISTFKRNKYFLSKDGMYCEVMEILLNEGEQKYSCNVISKHNLQPLFVTPINSGEWGIMKYSKFNKVKWKLTVLKRSDFLQKLYAMNNALGELTFFPVLHKIN